MTFLLGGVYYRSNISVCIHQHWDDAHPMSICFIKFFFYSQNRCIFLMVWLIMSVRTFRFLRRYTRSFGRSKWCVHFPRHFRFCSFTLAIYDTHTNDLYYVKFLLQWKCMRLNDYKLKTYIEHICLSCNITSMSGRKIIHHTTIKSFD